MNLEELIQMCGKPHRVISIVGGGGKTTLMYYLAEQCSRRKLRVLVGTTTHIVEPESHFAMSESEVLSLWKEGTYAVVGERVPGGKLAAPSGRLLERLRDKADLVLLEADGSKRLPCKVPGPHEPVILPESSLVIGVMGMSCLDRKAGECCFRLETAGGWLGICPDTPMSEDIAVSILSSASGTRKDIGEREYAVVLNQCDTEDIRRRAERIAAGLERKGIEKVLLTCFLQDQAKVDGRCRSYIRL